MPFKQSSRCTNIRNATTYSLKCVSVAYSQFTSTLFIRYRSDYAADIISVLYSTKIIGNSITTKTNLTFLIQSIILQVQYCVIPKSYCRPLPLHYMLHIVVQYSSNRSKYILSPVDNTSVVQTYHHDNTLSYKTIN